jgi:hypothetical protein
MRLVKMYVLWAFFTFGSGWALAQEPTVSLDQLKLLLGEGDKVTLVDTSGNGTKGRIERIASDSLAIRVGDEVRSFAEKDIRQISRKRQDAIWNGILIGAGVGFGASLPLYLGFAEDDETGLAFGASALWGLIGAGIGAVVDASVTQKQLVYFRPGSKISWSVRPFYSKSPLTKAGTGAFIPYPTRLSGDDPSKGLAVNVRF